MDFNSLQQNNFNELDKDGDGLVTVDEIIEHMSDTPLVSDVREMSNGVDANGNATIDFQVFLELMTIEMYIGDLKLPPKWENMPEEEMKANKAKIVEGFLAVDKYQTGFLTAAEVRDAIYKLTEGDIDIDQIDGWIKIFGAYNTGDGTINYEGFADFLQGNYKLSDVAKGVRKMIFQKEE